ncbi:MAG: hypothetical protein ACJAUW_001546, partial [Yoonia sp.]
MPEFTTDQVISDTSKLDVIASRFDVLDLGDLTGLGIQTVLRKNSDPATDMAVFADSSTMPLAQVERLIPCFTPGTYIATPRGAVLVETL